ncbi:hypothetical protein GCM10010275_65770 [Streptomyces litmocidini]|uniref:hypothetical protein n=1 Tax=Streptomyces litmocidini TaxID=67318 RepID=UPI00167E4257|nr:hypothetical protein [Streptomyces litmocidini]GGV15279.1 hypothetical protein GCM10010275_65770 [Streptomyces litmocidini]
MTRVPTAVTTPYWSSACRIGTHHECAHSSPRTAPIGIPVVYEACGCSCHSADTAPEAAS